LQLEVRGLLARGLQLIFGPVQLIPKTLGRVAALQRRQILAIARLVGRRGLFPVHRLTDAPVQVGKLGLRVDQRFQLIHRIGNPLDKKYLVETPIVL